MEGTFEKELPTGICRLTVVKPEVQGQGVCSAGSFWPFLLGWQTAVLPLRGSVSSTLHKDIRHIGLRLTLMPSFNVMISLKTLYPNTVTF